MLSAVVLGFPEIPGRGVLEVVLCTRGTQGVAGFRACGDTWGRKESFPSLNALSQ